MKEKILKINKKIIITLLIILLIYPNVTIYASNWNDRRKEFPNTPTGGSPDHTSEIKENNTIIDFDGVYGYVEENTGDKTIGKTGQDSNDKKIPIKNVKVTLLDNGVSTLTDKDGRYEFGKENFPEGTHTYHVKFDFSVTDSEIDACTTSNYKDIQEKLKYNIMDYSSKTTDYNTEIIKRAGKGVAQVFLVLDYSKSMKEEYITLSNGTQISKLKFEKERAKDIIDALLDKNKNIYVGLVVFTGDYYRRLDITNNPNDLYEALDDKRDKDFTTEYSTNVEGALDKAFTSFKNKKSENRYIFFLSDGIPTSDMTESMYSEDTESELNQKLKNITSRTKQKVEQILRDKVKMCSVFIGADNEDKGIINEIFNVEVDGNKNTLIDLNEGNIDKFLNKTIPKFEQYVKDSVEITNVQAETIETERQDKLIDFSTFNYTNTKYFEALDMEVNSSNLDEFKEYAKKINDYAVTAEGEFKLTWHTLTEEEKVKREYDEKGNVIRETILTVVPEKTKAVNLEVQKLQSFTITPTATITGLAVVASNSAVMENKTTKLNEKNILLADIKEEFLYGSKVLLQCVVDITNPSIYNDCNDLKILLYVPEGFEIDKNYSKKITGTNIDGKSKDLASVRVRYSLIDEYNVDTKNLSDEVKNYIKNEDENGNRHRAYLFNVEGINTEDFKLYTNGSMQLRFVLSKLVANSNENMIYTTSAEILEYSNTTIRRLQYKTTERGLVGATLGNHDTTELDYNKSNEAIVIVPTGKNSNIYYSLGAIIIFTIIGIILSKKYVN